MVRGRTPRTEVPLVIRRRIGIVIGRLAGTRRRWCAGQHRVDVLPQTLRAQRRPMSEFLRHEPEDHPVLPILCDERLEALDWEGAERTGHVSGVAGWLW